MIAPCPRRSVWGRMSVSLSVALALTLTACSSDEPTPGLPEPATMADPDAGDAARPLPSANVDVGSIEGHVAEVGTAPGNAVIRMGRDPKCVQLTTGKMVVQEAVVTNREGDLGNVFVHLEGEFPETTVSAEPVKIDQLECVYIPRVVGVQVGQIVEIHNSDELLHNVHSFSQGDNGFNIGQPTAGLVYRFEPESEEMMLRLGCDLHRWMTAYIGIVSHPYFDVTPATGTFTIENVPVGSYTIRTWHEVFGELSQTVQVTVGQTSTVEFAYTMDSESE